MQEIRNSHNLYVCITFKRKQIIITTYDIQAFCFISTFNKLIVIFITAD